MKIEAIKQLCKKNKTIVLYEDDKIQWIGNGSAIYPLYKMPEITESNIFTLFDIIEKKKRDYLFQEGQLPITMCFDDYQNGELLIEKERIRIDVNGNLLRPMQTSKGLVFVDEKYLKPVNDSEYLEMFERTTSDGKTYIVVKNGILLVAVIMPYDIISRDFVYMMEELTKRCRITYNIKDEKQKKEVEDERSRQED